MTKKSLKPLIEPNSKTSQKTEDICFSITVRTGNGVFLGSNTVQALITKLKEMSRYHCLMTEMEDDNEHLQGGIYLHSSKRQDNIRRDLNDLVIKIWEEEEFNRNKLTTLKQKALVSKHALCVKAHSNWQVLVNYCLKDVNRFISYQNNISLKELNYHCIHDNPKGCPKCQKSIEISLCTTEDLTRYSKFERWNQIYKKQGKSPEIYKYLKSVNWDYSKFI